MTKPKVSAIIQARMGSTRLPGKVLMPLAGKPVIWHVIHRLRKCRNVDVVAVATSDLPGDDELVSWCEIQGVPVFRGPEDNVLQRFALAAKALDAEVIIRVCGDSPMVDPQTIDRLVEELLKKGADHCTCEEGVASIHEGFSPLTRNALDRLLNEAANDPVAIEHVTAYFKEHPDKFKSAQISVPPEHLFSGARMSIDTPADLHFMEEVYARLAVPAGEADISAVVRLLQDHPELLQINCHVRQKTTTDRTFKIIIRCDGNTQIGLGHVVRCLPLASELRDKYSVGVSFAMATGKPGMDMVRQAGFPLNILQEDTSELEWLGNLLSEKNINALILDVRNDLACEQIRQWRESGIMIATIDDPSERRLEADLAFYPPVPQVKEMDWSGYTGQLFVGWDWVLMRAQFAEIIKKRVCNLQQNPSNPEPSILITMGGSDPAGLTIKAVQALDQVKLPFHATIVLGQAFAHETLLKELLENVFFQYTMMRNVENMVQVMQTADLALAAFGGTAYELAAVGVPGIYFALTEDHACSASMFEKESLGLNLGVHNVITEQQIVSAIEMLMRDKKLHEHMRYSCITKIDGLGAQRIANIIYDNLEKNDD